MNFAEYQERAARTAVYPHENWREYLAHGLIGEAGELSSAFAKFYRGDCDDSPLSSGELLRTRTAQPPTLCPDGPVRAGLTVLYHGKRKEASGISHPVKTGCPLAQYLWKRISRSSRTGQSGAC